MNPDFRTGRQKGKRNLPDAIKLDILQQKKLQMVTQLDIANKYGIARKTVNQLSEDDLSPKAKEQLDSFVQKLERVRNKTLNRIEQKIDNDEMPAAQLTPTFNTLNTALRLENDQPTSITAQQNIEPIALAIQSAWNKYKLFCEQNNIDHPSETDLIERINRVANERNVDAKMLAERVLKAD